MGVVDAGEMDARPVAEDGRASLSSMRIPISSRSGHHADRVVVAEHAVDRPAKMPDRAKPSSVASNGPNVLPR